MILTLEEMLTLEARIYVAMSEIDHDLKMWHRRHHNPTLAIRRAMIPMSYHIMKGAMGVKAFGAAVHH